MLTPILRRFLVTAAAATLVPLAALAPASPAGAVGPDCADYDTVLNGQYTLIPLKNQAMLTEERCGYRFRAGQQNSRITVTERDGGLFFHDTGSASWKSIEAPCAKRSVDKGVAAWCPVTTATSTSNPMLVEIWPRLGDDYLDASSLPAKFQLAALMDDGRDTVLAGAGNDFVNGAQAADKIRGGAGHDWLRSGKNPDDVDGGPGDDKIVSQEGADVVDGGAGRDSIYTAGGADLIKSGDNEWDLASCGDGVDQSVSDRDDKRQMCEQVTTYTGGDPDPSPEPDPTPEPDPDYTPETWGSRGVAYPDPSTELPRKAGIAPGIGPSSPYVQEIAVTGVVPLKDEAMIDPTPYGYLVRAGQQDSDLTMSVVDGRLRLVDPGTASWKYLPPECTNIAVAQGVAASCVIPSFFTESNAMLVDVWPRLGHDRIDSSALSARFDVTFLGDKGDEKAVFGAGDNFFNGGMGFDQVEGGAGRDWIRTGLDDDTIDGGAGGDYLVGVDGNDTIYGGAGDDNLIGLDGNDTLHGGSGTDRLSCGANADIASLFRGGRTLDCETVRYLD